MTRGEYLASRDWALKKRAVAERANGLCERCGAEGKQVHHLNYDRMYCELLTDLQYVCDGCHQFLSAKSDVDPVRVKRRAENMILARELTWNQAREELFDVLWKMIGERSNILSAIHSDTPTEQRLEIQGKAEEIRKKMYEMVDARAMELHKEYRVLHPLDEV